MNESINGVTTAIVWEPKERTPNLATKVFCGGQEVGLVGLDKGLYKLVGVP